MEDRRKLELCHGADSECADHGTHFGVRDFIGDLDGATDGYHSFEELYDHRVALTAALCKALLINSEVGMDVCWKSKQHHPEDSPIYDGYFIVGIYLDGGTITYHYPMKDWELFQWSEELPHAPKWDGENPNDTVRRLKQWTEHEGV